MLFRSEVVQPPPEPVVPRVTFHVETEPRGATVVLEGKNVGRTPLDVEVAVAASGLARAELALSLPGYQPTTVSASGESGRVMVKEKLRPANARPITGPAPANPPPVKKRSSGGKKPTGAQKLGDEDEDRPVPPGPNDGLKSPLLPKSN